MYLHGCEQISRTFSSCKTETLYPWNTNSPSLLTPFPGSHPPTFCFYDLDYFRHFTLSGIIQHLSFCHWLISLSIMSSGLLCVACCRNFLPFKGGIIFRCTHTVFSISIHLCMYLGCSPLLAMRRNAAVNMGAHISSRPCFEFLGIYSTQKWDCWLIW